MNQLPEQFQNTASVIGNSCHEAYITLEDVKIEAMCFGYIDNNSTAGQLAAWMQLNDIKLIIGFNL